MTRRRLRWSYLVFGLFFCAVAAKWILWREYDLDLASLVVAVPALLIAAGLAGLVATFRIPKTSKEDLDHEQETDPTPR